jgi:hypothetical protein
MSIVTLKKKTQTQYNNMSVGSKTGFSLNGTHRSQGYIGQTSLSRSFPRTLMHGPTMRGHGGCCGKYPLHSAIQSSVISTENINVVKSSTVGTSGLLATKYRWILRPRPYATVKPNTNNQEDYITRLRKKTIACDPIIKSVTPLCNCNDKTRSHMFGKSIVSYTKPKSTYVAMTQGEYLLRVDNKCREHDENLRPAN